MNKFFSSFFLTNNFLLAIGGVSVLFLIGHFVPSFVVVGSVVGLSMLLYFLFSIMILFWGANVSVEREMSDYFSNGDDNSVELNLKSSYAIPVSFKIIDEIPFQFQERNLSFFYHNNKRKELKLRYTLKPKARGEYFFGHCNVFASLAIFPMIRRRFVTAEPKRVKVYPSFQQLSKYELATIGNELNQLGAKKIRKIGQQSEFEKIKDYVQGDDIRTINWKATARRSQLMVNQYQDERSQNVYSILDLGRPMKSAFDNMTLLDYSINASLMMSSISLKKQDHAGLISFAENVKTIIPANNQRNQLRSISESLYSQETAYKESNFEKLYIQVRKQIGSRSLLFLFTNFDSWTSLNRQIRYLRRIGKLHLLVVVFFENKYIHEIAETKSKDVSQVFQKTVAEKQRFEQKKMKELLTQYGIYSVFTSPEHLSVNALNKYIELKARNLI